MDGRNYVGLGCRRHGRHLIRAAIGAAARARRDAIASQLYGGSGQGPTWTTRPCRLVGIARDKPAAARERPAAPLEPGSRQRHHLERGVDSELRHEAVQVGADRVRGQLQPARDLFPADALDQEQQDVPLTRRESREQVVAVAAVMLILDEQVQHRRLAPWEAARSRRGRRRG